MRRLLLSLPFLLASLPALAADCGGQQAQIDAIADAFLAKEQVTSPGDIPDYKTARCMADALVAIIGTHAEWGPPVGYKVGLTSKGVQQRMGIDTPAWGILTKGMLIPSGGKIARQHSARPLAEADLMVTIADDGIMTATTVEEASQHISELTAFIELTDIVYADGITPTLVRAVAINVGARHGVVGNSVPMTPALFAALPHLTVNMTTLGQKRWDSEGTRLMGHPLAPLVWLVGKLKEDGRALKAGDVVALGSFGPPLTPDMPGQDMIVTYTDEKGNDLPGGPLSVKITFSP